MSNVIRLLTCQQVFHFHSCWLRLWVVISFQNFSVALGNDQLRQCSNGTEIYTCTAFHDTLIMSFFHLLGSQACYPEGPEWRGEIHRIISNTHTPTHLLKSSRLQPCIHCTYLLFKWQFVVLCPFPCTNAYRSLLWVATMNICVSS